MKQRLLVLGLILLALFLRLTHINMPSIGAHNLKENDYLSQAQHQFREGFSLERSSHVLNADGITALEEYPQPPILPTLISTMWHLFGFGFWQARVVILIFSLLTIPLFFQFSVFLLGSSLEVFLSTLWMCLLPASIFYGRNIQPEIPALCVALLALLIGLSIPKESKPALKMSIAYGFLWSVVALFKPTFLVLLIPSLLMFEDLPKKIKRDRTTLVLGAASFFFLPLLFLFFTHQSQWTLWKIGSVDRVDLTRLFHFGYWHDFAPMFYAQLEMAFTLPMLILTLIGSGLCLFSLKHRLLKRFVVGTLFSFIPYMLLLSDYVIRHDYYWVPYLPWVCLCSAYALLWLRENALIRLRWPLWKWVPLLIFFLTIPDIWHFKNEHFDTIYYGLDAAADYLKEYSSPKSKVWIVGGPQAYGVCFNADRLCAPMPEVEENLKKFPDFQWIFVAAPHPNFKSQEQTDFVNKNFELKIFGEGPFMQNGRPIPCFYLYGRKDNAGWVKPQNKIPEVYRYQTTHGELLLRLERLQ